jgi:hypothetical protein
LRRWLALCLALSGCFMTADEDLWKQMVDAGPDQPGADVQAVDAPRPDAARDVSQDVSRDGPIPDSTPDLAKPDITPPDLTKPDMACKQMVLKVTASTDDGEIDNNNFLVNGESGTILSGYWGGPNATWAFFRFELDQALPAGAVVTGASLELWGVDMHGSWDPASDALEVLFEDAADVSSAAGKKEDAPFLVGGRPVVNAKVRWPTAGGLAWQLNQYHATPNLKTPIQELVNKYGGLAQNAHLQLWIRGVQAKQAEVGTHDFLEPGYAAHPHKLTVSWCH